MFKHIGVHLYAVARDPGFDVMIDQGRLFALHPPLIEATQVVAVIFSHVDMPHMLGKDAQEHVVPVHHPILGVKNTHSDMNAVKYLAHRLNRGPISCVHAWFDV